MTAQDWLLIIGGLTTLVGAIAAAVVTVVKAINDGKAALLAANAVQTEQRNRALMASGVEPVTLANTVTLSGTGDGGTAKQQTADAATVELLTKATPPPEGAAR